MKKILMFISLAALLSSCGNNYLSGGNVISIRMKSGMRNDYKLLSVRDSSLVVIDAKDDATLQTSYSHAEVIRFDLIYKVYRIGKRSTGDYILGATSGLIAGGLMGTALAPPPTPKPRTYIPPGAFDEVPTEYDNSKTYIDLVIGAAIGVAFGYILAYIIPAGSKQLHPIFPQDKELLHEVSLYSHGEPEMLKLVH